MKKEYILRGDYCFDKNSRWQFKLSLFLRTVENTRKRFSTQRARGAKARRRTKEFNHGFHGGHGCRNELNHRGTEAQRKHSAQEKDSQRKGHEAQSRGEEQRI